MAAAFVSVAGSVRAEQGPLRVPTGAVQIASLADFEAATLPAGAPYVLVVSERELNERVAHAAAEATDLPLRDLAVRLLQDRVELSGRARLAGVELAPTVALRLWAEGDEVRLEIVRIGLGAASLPGPLTGAVSAIARRQLDTAKLAERYPIEGIWVRAGALTLVSRVK